MRFSDGVDVREFAGLVRRAAAGSCGTDARSLWRELGRAGILQHLLGHRGGPAHELLDHLIVELDAAAPLGSVLSTLVQVATALPLLRATAGDSPVAHAALTDALAGKAVIALAVTDAGISGSALLDMSTRVELDQHAAVLTGGKEWITNAGICDFALVLARTRPVRHFTSFSWVLVPGGHPGVGHKSATTSALGGAAIGHLRFDAVRLTPSHVVGRPGRALAEFAHRIVVERLASALWARALCRRVLTCTHHYLRARRTGTGTLWDNAAVRERFARCLLEWSRLDAMCTRHAVASPTVTEGMLLKTAGADAVEHILGECVQLRGADAFGDSGLAELRAQAAMFGIAGGSTGVMLASLTERVDEILADGSAGCGAFGGQA